MFTYQVSKGTSLCEIEWQSLNRRTIEYCWYRGTRPDARLMAVKCGSRAGHTHTYIQRKCGNRRNRKLQNTDTGWLAGRCWPAGWAVRRGPAATACCTDCSGGLYTCTQLKSNHTPHTLTPTDEIISHFYHYPERFIIIRSVCAAFWEECPINGHSALSRSALVPLQKGNIQ